MRKIIEFIQNVFRLKEILEENETLDSENSILNNQNIALVQENEKYKEEFDKLDEEINKLNDEIVALQESSLDIFCQGKYTKIDNKAYTNKREVFGVEIDVFLNELITPNAFEVVKVRRKLISDNQKLQDKALIVGNYISENFLWKSDSSMFKEEDFYIYPNEALKIKLCDCEDHSYTVASIEPEIGVAYGFYYPNTKTSKTKTGHAFNVFVLNDKLYILETTGDRGEIIPYEGNNKYDINFIVTKNNTYMLDGSVEFGVIAQWN